MPCICYEKAEKYLKKDFSFNMDTSATKASLGTDFTKSLKIVNKLLNNALNKIEISQCYVFLKIKWRFSI